MFTSLLLSFFFLCGFQGNDAQNDTGRGFQDLSPFTMDVDGDGKPDKLVPRTYVRKVTPKKNVKPEERITETHWITFDLVLADNRIIKSVFTFEYGNNLADYWSYGIETLGKNKNGRLRLRFSAGDDTGYENITLESRVGKFLIKRKVSGERGI